MLKLQVYRDDIKAWSLTVRERTGRKTSISLIRKRIKAIGIVNGLTKTLKEAMIRLDNACKRYKKTKKTCPYVEK